jgi:hypothetical protein
MPGIVVVTRPSISDLWNAARSHGWEPRPNPCPDTQIAPLVYSDGERLMEIYDYSYPAGPGLLTNAKLIAHYCLSADSDTCMALHTSPPLDQYMQENRHICPIVTLINDPGDELFAAIHTYIRVPTAENFDQVQKIIRAKHDKYLKAEG